MGCRTTTSPFLYLKENTNDNKCNKHTAKIVNNYQNSQKNYVDTSDGITTILRKGNLNYGQN